MNANTFVEKYLAPNSVVSCEPKAQRDQMPIDIAGIKTKEWNSIQHQATERTAKFGPDDDRRQGTHWQEMFGHHRRT